MQRKLIKSAKYLVNRMNGVKSRGEGSDLPPPPPLIPSCNFFRPMPSAVNNDRSLKDKFCYVKRILCYACLKSQFFTAKIWLINDLPPAVLYIFECQYILKN